MDKDLLYKLSQLLVEPDKEQVDHLAILEEIYNDYQFENESIKPLIQFYINGLDDLPTLSQKPNWNIKKFIEYRKPFLSSYHVLKNITEQAIRDIIEDKKNRNTNTN